MASSLFINSPEILLLDQPTLEMDQVNKIKAWELLDKIGQNKTILFVSQDLSEVEKYADRISIWFFGRRKYIPKIFTPFSESFSIKFGSLGEYVKNLFPFRLFVTRNVM